ncbi:hypothetical protein [Gryllotalpicola protaetiae]|uniref:Uncharacterized protein n=1 Tax=Gryllotalpicola protaetiae TaxID=2419771 RepID=A0A387BN37_9MICO|nr:hypothetical protein [Gryllotalpicola protaetiae]AYG02407.1 hypothetical protein D7I44_01880 [Gryllotalpicola protaetiae]
MDDIRLAAARNLAQTLSEMIGAPIALTWRALTCGEAEDFAALLRAFGHGDAAADLIAEHAEADGEGDWHYPPDGA